MASSSLATANSGSILWFLSQNPTKTLHHHHHHHHHHNLLPLKPFPRISSISISDNVSPLRKSNGRLSCNCISSTASPNTNYEFYDGSSEVELRLPLGGLGIRSSKDIFVDADGTSLVVRAQPSYPPSTLLETNHLFERVKPSETMWYIDEDELVINLKKYDPDVKWPDIVESWESLTSGSTQLLKGASIFIVGDSTEINRRVARELAVGLGYTPLDTHELLEQLSEQTIESWLLSEGQESLVTAECQVLESLSSHVRTVVSTMGGKEGAARRSDKWRHIYAGFSVWLSQTEATDENSAKEEARKHVQEGSLGYSNAEVVVKLQGWDADHAKAVAQASLSALKKLIISDKELPGKKSLYVRLGCHGDWPDIKPPGGWDPSTEGGKSS